MTDAAAGRPADAKASESQSLLIRLIRDQRFAFLVVGGFNTLVGLGGFYVFSRFIHLWSGDAAVLAAQCIAIPSAFALHRRFVFKVRGHVMRDFGRFVLVNAVPVAVNLAVLPLLTKGLGWPEFPAQLAFTVAWVLASYFIHRGFSFRRTDADHEKLAAKDAARAAQP